MWATPHQHQRDDKVSRVSFSGSAGPVAPMVDIGAGGTGDASQQEAASSAAAAPSCADGDLRPGHLVEVNGLASESGKLLNGQRGLLCDFLEATGRWQVRIGEKLVSLKPVNLTKAELFTAVPTPEAVSEREPEQVRRKSRSRSRSSSSSSSSSSSRSTARKEEEEAPLKTGEEVEIFGLSSEGGKALNGQKGVVTEYSTERDRWEVMISLEKVVSLRPRNLRRSKPPPGAMQPGRPGQKQKAEGSLASLLGMGKAKEEPRSESQQASSTSQWQSVWSRSAGQAQAARTPASAMSRLLSLDMAALYLESFQTDAEKVELKRLKRESKIRRELVMQGITDEDMVREVIRQREEERQQTILFRGKAAARDSDSSRSPSGEPRATPAPDAKKRSHDNSSSSSSSSSESKKRKVSAH
eukprot:s16_g12.t1